MSDSTDTSEPTEQPTAKAPMTSFQRTIIWLMVALIAIIAAAVITFMIVEKNKARQIELDACEAYGIGSFDYYFCQEMVD